MLALTSAPLLGFSHPPGLIQPELLPDGQVKVDMGEPILEGPKIPTTLAPTQGSTVVEQVRHHQCAAATLCCDGWLQSQHRRVSALM